MTEENVNRRIFKFLHPFFILYVLLIYFIENDYYIGVAIGIIMIGWTIYMGYSIHKMMKVVW